MHFTLDEISTKEFSVRGRNIFYVGQPDLLALFEKENYSIYEGLPLLNTFVTLKFDCLSYFLRASTKSRGPFN